MFTRIANILPEKVKSSGAEPHFSRARVLELVSDCILKSAPEETRGAFRIVSLQDKVLTISCRTSACTYLLKSREKPFLDAVREKCGEGVCTHLRFMMSTWS